MKVTKSNRTVIKEVKRLLKRATNQEERAKMLYNYSTGLSDRSKLMLKHATKGISNENK
jgi:hypothetical protein